MMNFHYHITVATILIFTLFDIIIKGEKYDECDNLDPNKIKILEQKKEIRVWLGSEVSLTCCMKTLPKYASNNNDFDEDFDVSGNEQLTWFDPKMKPIVNYFIDPSKAQQTGIFMIPEALQKYKDIQVVHLVIKNFSTPDNGMYKCDTTATGQFSEQISIIGNPKIIIDAEEYQFLEEGQMGLIKCRPRGHPKIGVVWFYEGEHLSLDNHKFSFLDNHQVLRIWKVTENFAGKYLCKAEVSIADQMGLPDKGSYIEVQPIQVIVYKKPTLSNDSPSIKPQSKSPYDIEAVVIEDDVLELECDSTGLPPPSITWYRDNKVLNSSADHRVKISESYYRRNAYSVLRIKPVEIKDVGLYTCNSSYSFHGFTTSVAKNITPEFMFQPRFLKIGTNLNASPLVGKDIVLNCSVFGAFSKRLNVIFIREDFNYNITLFGDDSSRPSVKYVSSDDPRNSYISHYQLTIRDIQPSDAGWYYCQASIKAGNVYGISDIGVVSVLYGPKVSPIKSTAYGLWYKKNVLKCKAKGYPNPVWEWKFQEFPLSKQFNQYQMKIINKNDTSISELTILPNYLNDAIFGTYQCIAENQFGSDSNTISFSQAWQPAAPNVSVSKITASTIHLSVSPNSDSGGLPLTHYEMRIKDSEINKFFGPFYYPVNPSTITLSHLKPNMGYKIALSAVSEAGRGANTEVEVTTKPIGPPVVELVNKSTAPEWNAYNLNWVVDTNGGFPIIQYDVEIQQVNADPVTKKVIERIGEVKSLVINDLSQLRHMFRVNSLAPDTWYELKFTAKNVIGPSMIQTVVFRTLTRPDPMARSDRLRDPFKSANHLKQSLMISHSVVTLFLVFLFFD